MARTVRDTNLDTRAARLRLKPQPKPYWRSLETGVHIGYRRLKTGGGSWIGRRFIGGAQPYVEKGMGLADDFQDADGETTLDFRAAQKRVRQWAADGERTALGLEPISGPYTIEAALKDYFADRAREGSKGIPSDRSAANARIVPELGALEVSKISSRRIKDWLSALAGAPRLVRSKATNPKRSTKDHDQADPEAVRARRATANRILTVLKAALNHAFEEGRTASDEAWRKVKPFREADAPVVRFLSTDECQRLVNACAEPFRDLVRGALLTGCRYGELVRMQAGDFNEGASTITVRVSKSGKPRHVALSDEGCDLFSNLTAGRGSRELVFRRQDGTPWLASQQQRPLAEACKNAKINPPATFHVLRHSYASALAMRGVPMAVIAAQLGHQDTRMTERHYAHLAPSYVSDAVRAALPSLGIVERNNVATMKTA